MKWTNLKKLDRNQTKICPGQKFVTNEYPGYIYIYIYTYIYIFLSILGLSQLYINIYTEVDRIW